MNKLAAAAYEDATSQGQVAVEPGLPEASAIWLHIHHVVACPRALAHWLQLQARAASGRIDIR